MRIRQGNDFIFLWAIERNELPEDFSNAVNVRLHFKNFDCVGEVKSFQIVDSNIVRVEVSPEWASRLGAYRLILSYEFENNSYSDGDRKCVVDVLAFNIVPKTSEADDVTEMAKTTDIMIGFYGLSAYEVWLKDNPESTKEDYYNWLRQPATDAVSLIDDKIEHLDEVIDSSIENESERVTAESTRKTAEATRISAETERKANEVDRLADEASRASDELTRQLSESERVENEDVRIDNERGRVQADLSREQRTNTAIQAVTGAQIESEEVISEALNDFNTRVEVVEDAEVIREQNEQDRQTNTATAITNAENAITDVNDAKDDYYDVVKPAIQAQGVYAQAQGDYAKAQGDLLNNRMPLFYGVEFAKGSLDPNSTRWIGDDAFKSNHVIFNDFKVAKVKDGKVIGVLNQTNWFEMEDGAPSGVVIDGTDVTDDGCDIMLVNEKGFYVLNGGTDPDFERRIVSDAPFHYGNDRAIYIEPFGMTVDFAIVKSGVSRCIRDNTHSGTATTGNGGASYLADGLGVPTTYVNRFNAEGYARAKNANNSLNVPYANTFHLDKNVWATLLFIKFQTKDLHNQDCIGPCISANDSTPNIWGDKTGIRVKNIDETYSHYNTNSSRFMSAVGGTSWNFYQLINNYRPLLKIFDCQLALSHAKQNNISQNTLFEYDGFQYSYENIQGSKGIADGEMTAKVRKFVTVQFTGYDNVDKVDVIDKDVEYCLEQGIVNGKIAGWGNVFEWISGIEGVIDGTDNSKYLFYKTDDVRKLTTDSDATDKDIGEKFSFQNSYDFLGSDNNVNGYVLKMFDNAIIGETLGGSLHTGECAYRYSSTSAPVDKLVRRGVCSGGSANFAVCALRFASAVDAPTVAYSSIAFGFRVTLEKV